MDEDTQEDEDIEAGKVKPEVKPGKLRGMVDLTVVLSL